MTDRKYQRALNSLIREDKRIRLNPPAARDPVPGGSGYAANSPPDVSTMDTIYILAPLAVNKIGPPPLEQSEQVQAVATDPKMCTVIGDDVFTVHEASGTRKVIWKNGAAWKTSGFTEIIGMTGSSTELYVIDGGTAGADPIVVVLDITDASTARTLTSGTEAWQGSGNLNTTFTPSSANDTHFVITVTGAAHKGYWLYESDFTYVDKILFQNGIYGKPSLRPDKLYTVDQKANGRWGLQVFALTGGTATDSQEIPTAYDSYSNYELTDRTFYFVDDSGSDKLIVAFPRETGADTFDFTAPDSWTDVGTANDDIVETNRDMTELF